MNEPTKKTKFTEDQMDQLLSTFYQMELPAELENLPSSWPDVIRQSADKIGKSATVTLRSADPETTSISRPATSTAGRGIVVAVATLATCLMIMALSNPGQNGSPSHSIVTPVEPQDRDAPGVLIDVSENPDAVNNGIIDENGMTIDELDIRIESSLPKRKEEAKEEK